MPTGAGKSTSIMHIVCSALAKGKTVWVIASGQELIAKTSREFTAAGIPHSVIIGGRVGNTRSRVQIASVQTLVGWLDRLPRPDLIIVDEAHHGSAETWRRIMTHHGVPLIGFTATPCRQDGQPLGEFFDVMVEGPGVRDLIDMTREDGLPGGYLADYRLFIAPAGEDVSDITKRGGEIPAEAVYKRVRGPKRTGNIVQHYGDLANGVRTILFACTIADSIELSAAFCRAGIPAQHMDGTMSSGDRERELAKFEVGATSVLTTVGLFGEGIHVPGAGCVIHARPTASLARNDQGSGRGFAPKADGSSLILLDHAGNYGKINGDALIPNHPFPDEKREWSLTGTMRRPQAGDPAIAIRQCAKCGSTVRPSVRRCPDPCGYDFPAVSGPIKQASGTLVEIDTRTARARVKSEKEEQKRLQMQLDEQNACARKAEEMACKSEAELAALGQARGYKSPRGWAAKKWPIIAYGRASRAAADMRRRNG